VPETGVDNILEPEGYYGANSTPFSTISGTASDLPEIGDEIKAQLDKVYVRIKRSPDGTEYWGESGGWMVDDSTWVVCSGTSPWTYDEPSIDGWQDGRRYDIYSRAKDYAGNLSAWTTYTFYYDTNLPKAGGVVSTINSYPASQASSFP